MDIRAGTPILRIIRVAVAILIHERPAELVRTERPWRLVVVFDGEDIVAVRIPEPDFFSIAVERAPEDTVIRNTRMAIGEGDGISDQQDMVAWCDHRAGGKLISQAIKFIAGKIDRGG